MHHIENIDELRERLAEAEQTLAAIRAGEVDSLVIEAPDGLRVYALEGASNSYRVLMENMSEGAATLNEKGIILYSNGRLAGMLDVPLERVMGSPIRDFVPPRLHASLEALLRSAGDGAREELSLVNGNGAELPAYLSVNAIEEEGRRVLCLVATDLRSQKRNEAMLANERLARSVLEQAADAIVVCDEQARIIRASEAAAHLCERNPLLAPFDEVFPVALSDPRFWGTSAARAALRGETWRAMPASLARPGRETLALLVSAAPLRDAEHRIIGCVLTLVDVTATRRSEQAMRENEERLRLALEGGMLGVWDWDLRTGSLTWDERCKQIFGLPADAALDRERFSVSLHPEDRQRVRDAAEEAARNAGLCHEQYRIFRPDGRMRWLESRGRVFRDASGEPARMSGVVVDITERKLAEEALRETEQRRNHFLAMLSHELRNPLAPIKISLYLLQRAEPGSEQAKRAQAVIERQVRQLTGLVDDLLDVTRISRDKIELKRERLELNELVRRAAEDHHSLFEESGVALRLELAPSAIVVNADRTRLVQVFGNLLQNACKFTGRGGSAVVSVACNAEEKQAIVRFLDTGVGFPAEMLPRLFEPFAQAEHTLDRTRGGLGLGLALVKGLVEMHGGEVSARSAGPGKGAELIVRLPIEEGRLEQGATPCAERARSSRRILIIEDNRDAADSLREVLQLGGHEIEVAYASEEGLARARQFRPEVVLCDIGLPGMDGYALARAFREDEALKDTYLVALSGYALPEDLERAGKAGFDRHLAKPSSLDKLEEVFGSVPPVQRSLR